MVPRDLLKEAAIHADQIHQGEGFMDASTVLRIKSDGILVTTFALHPGQDILVSDDVTMVRDSRTITWDELDAAGWENPIISLIDQTRAAVLEEVGRMRKDISPS